MRELLMLADLGAPKVLASMATMARAVVDTLAIADEGVASRRRPGAAAVRPRQT
jgi:hypothetical protein